MLTTFPSPTTPPLPKVSMDIAVTETALRKIAEEVAQALSVEMGKEITARVVQSGSKWVVKFKGGSENKQGMQMISFAPGTRVIPVLQSGDKAASQSVMTKQYLEFIRKSWMRTASRLIKKAISVDV